MSEAQLLRSNLNRQTPSSQGIGCRFSVKSQEMLPSRVKRTILRLHILHARVLHDAPPIVRTIPIYPARTARRLPIAREMQRPRRPDPTMKTMQKTRMTPGSRAAQFFSRLMKRFEAASTVSYSAMTDILKGGFEVFVRRR